jgi:hypothetical protein
MCLYSNTMDSDNILNSLDNASLPDGDLSEVLPQTDEVNHSRIMDRMQSRRELSEKLENDEKYREEYIAQAKVKQQKALAELVERLNSGNYSPADSEPKNSEEPDDLNTLSPEESSEPLPLAEPESSNGKHGVYIHNVKKIVINIKL